MIISHKYKFIFIKTAKTAGTSIEIFLSQICEENDIVTPIWPHVAPHEPRNHKGIWNPLPEIFSNRGRGATKTLKQLSKLNKFYNHMPARLVKQRVPSDIFNSYFKFCVERNPWDKTLSHYHMISDRTGGIAFEDYIQKQKFCFNYPRYTDRKGALLVDKIIQFESLHDGLADVFNLLGIPFDGSLNVRAKSEHRSDKRNYQDVYTDDQKEVVQQAFAKEIAMHGYVY